MRRLVSRLVLKAGRVAQAEAIAVISGISLTRSLAVEGVAGALQVLQADGEDLETDVDLTIK